MRTIILFLSFILVFASCKKDDTTEPTNVVTDSTMFYTDAQGTFVRLTNAKWFTVRNGSFYKGFSFVNLSIAGSTNADKVSIETYGDGAGGDLYLVIDSNKNFKKDSIIISYIHYNDTLPTYEFERYTRLKAIKGTDTLRATLYSGKLKY